MNEQELKRPGDQISIETRRGGVHTRSGEVLEVLGEPGHEHYLVRWNDGKASYVYPRQVVETAKAAPLAPAARPHPQVEPAWERGLTAEPGDRLVIHGHRQGEPERDAEILEVRGRNGGPPFLVRWENTGHEALLYPGSDAHVEHLATGRRRAG